MNRSASAVRPWAWATIPRTFHGAKEIPVLLANAIKKDLGLK